MDANASNQDDQTIRAVLSSSGRLSVPVETLASDADLFAAGLDSLAIVNVLMAIEETFDVEFPEAMLSRKSFSSIANLAHAVAELRAAGGQS